MVTSSNLVRPTKKSLRRLKPAIDDIAGFFIVSDSPSQRVQSGIRLVKNEVPGPALAVASMVDGHQ